MRNYKLFRLKVICISVVTINMFISCRSNEPELNTPTMHQEMIGSWIPVDWSLASEWYITNDSIVGLSINASGDTVQYRHCYRLLNDDVIYIRRCYLSRERPDYDVITNVYFTEDNLLVIGQLSSTSSQCYPPQYVATTLKRK